MYSFTEWGKIFEEKFGIRQFPQQPSTLYDAAQYLFGIGGKRIRPVCVLMGNDLFDEVKEDAYEVASAVEMFHNFSLVHDDIMDNAPLRRGKATVHSIYGQNTAILAGDVMFARCYEYLVKIDKGYIQQVVQLFNKTAAEVCEGQQLDMDFELRDDVTLAEYLQMITLKTSVLLAASLQLGAMIGGASVNNQKLIYEFGKCLGIAFQVQDDYLDAFGNPEVFGKQPGGDILANKKTFLLLHALEKADADSKKELLYLLKNNADDKVEKVIGIYKSCEVDKWAASLKKEYFDKAMKHLDDIAVISNRKAHLKQLAESLMVRTQ